MSYKKFDDLTDQEKKDIGISAFSESEFSYSAYKWKYSESISFHIEPNDNEISVVVSGDEGYAVLDISKQQAVLLAEWINKYITSDNNHSQP